MLITTSINSEMRVRAQTETEENLIIIVSMLNTFSDSTVSPKPLRERKKEEKRQYDDNDYDDGHLQCEQPSRA